MAGRGERFEALDGLRGVAAVCVLAYHTGLRLPDAPADGSRLAPHGWPAVDLFFVLSGFVIAQAYGRRLRTGMTARAFGAARVRRLYPTYLAGLGLSLACSVLAWSQGRLEIPLAVAAWLTLPALALLPMPGGGLAAFPLNPPTWSLLVEAVANTAYAAGLRRAGPRVLTALLAAFGLALCIAVQLGQSPNGGSRADELWMGLLRGGYAFTAGLLLHAIRERGRLPVLRVPTGLLLLLAGGVFMLPDGEHARWLEVGFMLFGPPLLVAAAVQSTPGVRLARFCAGAGAVSYPLYVLHAPLLELAARLTPLDPSQPTARIAAVALAAGAALLGAGLLERASRPAPPRSQPAPTAATAAR